ncbi:MAG TPA: ABC transporter substrate-binding protein [Solirubrobacteraceae bacterium]|nr:ABC transporter substrate-binding protein [Solirubrobacteraceae bacterium]
MAAGAARRGGTLRVGALGKRSTIERDPHKVQANESDYLISCLVYEALTVPGSTPVAPRLMSRWQASSDMRRWRFEIADGATFHDGSRVSADDVVWSLRRLRNLPNGEFRLPGISANAVRKDSPRSIVISTNGPNAEVPMAVRLQSFVFKEGERRPGRGPGCGPFKLISYDDGDAVLARHPDWHGGDVPLERIEVRLFADVEALTAAILGGQVDVAENVGPLAARLAVRDEDLRIVRRPNDMAMPVVMRVADGPFADPRVRQAIRLTVDRPRLVRGALNGYGTVANDVLGTGDPLYLGDDIGQRARDLDAARGLLRDADLDLSRSYDLLTTSDAPGLVESATLFATQMKDAGLRVNVVRQDSAAFYDTTWLKAPLYTTYWGTNDSVLFFVARTMTSRATQNETGWTDERIDGLYRRAVGDRSEERRAQAVRDLQRLQHEQGGYVVWGMADGVDVARANVRGLPRTGGYGRMFIEKSGFAA